MLPEATGEGHCALPKEALIEQAAKLLEIDVAIVREALERLLLDGELVLEPIGGHDLIYLPYLRRAEDGIAGLLRKLARRRRACRQSILRRLLPGASGRQVKSWRRHNGKPLKALESRVLVITGGPGPHLIPETW